MVRVVYQGEFRPRQYLRALVPTPIATMVGFVTLPRTFCYATPVDPQHPGNYTRAGLDIIFRPHAEIFAKDDAVDPASKSFFKRGEFGREVLAVGRLSAICGPAGTGRGSAITPTTSRADLRPEVGETRSRVLVNGTVLDPTEVIAI